MNLSSIASMAVASAAQVGNSIFTKNTSGTGKTITRNGKRYSQEAWNKKMANHSKQTQFPDNAKLRDGRDVWYKKNGQMVRRTEDGKEY